MAEVYVLWCWMEMQADECSGVVAHALAGASESNPAPPRPDPLRVWARIAPSFGGLWRLQTFVCVRGVSAIPHIYPSVLQALAGRGRTGRLEGGFQGYRDGAMHYLGYELPRISILGSWVNKPSGALLPKRWHHECALCHGLCHELVGRR